MNKINIGFKDRWPITACPYGQGDYYDDETKIVWMVGDRNCVPCDYNRNFDISGNCVWCDFDERGMDRSR